MTNTPNFTELPDSFRAILKSSIEQAKKAFDTFVSTSEKVVQGFDTSSSSTTGSLKQLNEKIATFTRENAEANFNLALRLTEAKQLSEVVELQSAHVREQMDKYSHQLEELRDLTVKAVKETSQAAGAAVPANPFSGTFGG